MSFLTILGIAVALAMDAFAVAMATGICLKQVNFRQTFRLSWHFGLFQALMPIIGWGAGMTFRSAIEQYDHWVAFGLLALIGANMLKEAFGKDDHCDRMPKDATKGLTLIVLSIATSIDALAIGLSLSVLNTSIIFPAVIIGLVAGLFTIIGLHLGRSIASAARLSKVSEISGALVLWAIGIKILIEHQVISL